ncbi:MAG: hypothetical protein AAF739_09850 [Pseudomonadota bacterium]
MSVPVALSAALALAGVGAVAAAPKPGQPVMALFPPATAQSQVLSSMAASGGHLISTTNVSWAVLTQADDPAFAERLRQHGALLTIDPRVAAWCFGGAYSL